jgi:hypothetical protein
LEGNSSLHNLYIGRYILNKVEPSAYKRAFRPSIFAESHFQVSIVRSGGSEERGPAGVQVGTGEDQVSIANLFTLHRYSSESAFFHGLVFDFLVGVTQSRTFDLSSLYFIKYVALHPGGGVVPLCMPVWYI